MLVFGLPIFRWGRTHSWNSLVGIDLLSQALAGLVLFLYVPVAMVNARRYRCSRTSWRHSILSRAYLRNSSRSTFRGWASIPHWAATPYFQTQRQAFLHAHTYFGNQRF